MKTIREYCEDLYPEIVSLRREFHRHPEEGMTCVWTTDRICRELEKEGISYRRTGEVGAIAEIKGTKAESKAMVMIRGDMDALVVTEKTGLPYASEIPGKMHACGHDFHTSMLLGSAKVLNQLKDTFAGTVRFIFQPGEEVNNGSRYMIEHGAMEGVDMGLGIHMDPLSPVGVLKSKVGPDWASVDMFTIRIHGKGAHGATPQNGCDALVAAAATAMNLQTIVSRECDPMKPLVVTIGKLTAGTAYNVIPEEAVLEGTCRSFDDDVWEMIPAAMERIAKNTAKAYRCEAELEMDRSTRALINDETAYEVLKNAALKVLDKPEDLQPAVPEMIGEDFSAYGKYAPTVFAHLGADGGYPLHNGAVNFKEEAIPYGMAVEVQFALDALAKYSQVK